MEDETMPQLTEDFLSHFYYGVRDDYLERVQEGKKPLSEVFLGLTRNNPVVITCDKNLVPNGAVKSVGYHLKEEFLDDTIKEYESFLNWRWEKVKEAVGGVYEGEGWVYSPNPDFIVDGLKHSLKHIYLPKEETEKKVDFEKLGTLEGFYKRTWENIQQNNKVAIVYYYPPGIHFQVNCTVEIQKSGPLREFINRAACLAHGENPAKWEKRTAYIFHVEGVIDKSVYPKSTHS
jgi:hypothetical protein